MLYKQVKALLPALIGLTGLSCQDQSSNVNTAADITPNTPPAAPVSQTPTPKIIYRDFQLENSLHNGYKYISGLFATPENTDKINEVFRINGQVTDEPVLIGLQLDCNIPDYRINGAIQVMVEKDDLQLLAGGPLSYTNNEPLGVEDFRDVVAEGPRYQTNKYQGNDQPN